MRTEDITLQHSLNQVAQFAIGQAMAVLDVAVWENRAIRVHEDVIALYRPHDRNLPETSKRLRVIVEIMDP